MISLNRKSRNLSGKSEKRELGKEGMLFREAGRFERKGGNGEVGGKGQPLRAQCPGGETWDFMELSVEDLMEGGAESRCWMFLILDQKQEDQRK